MKEFTEDGHEVQQGDILFNYYDMRWGRVLTPPDEEGWFSFQEMDGRNCMNGARTVKDPNNLHGYARAAIKANGVSMTPPEDGLEE